VIEDRTHALADEQSALRNVATLVARGASPAEVIDSVCAEIGRLIPADAAGIGRYESDGTGTAMGGWSRAGGYHIPVGAKFGLDPGTAGALVLETRQSVRVDTYEGVAGEMTAAARAAGWRSAVGTPITVNGRLWGVASVASKSDQPFPPDTERRLAQFTELLATAIANAESQAELSRLANEQAALRRVATLVAQGKPPEQVFAGVAQEIAQVLGVEMVTIDRYEPDGSSSVVVASYEDPGFPVGSRWRLDGPSLGATVLATGRPARVDEYADLESTSAAVIREQSINSTVGVPVVVEGAVWGVICVGTAARNTLPSDTEDRLAAFTGLIETAISNARARAELMASRARIAAAADETRKQIERDLHDGAQQRLVSLGLELRAALSSAPPELDELRRALSDVCDGLARVSDELREISHGLHPAILSDGGLPPALQALRRRCAIPVHLHLHTEGRLPERLEVAVYYVVSEALTNAVKHAQASAVTVDLDANETVVRLAIRDDGVGGADASRGSGLIGLRDRVESLGGTTRLESPTGRGTALLVEVPLDETGAPAAQVE
jgi:signal transduction histidine kinase